MQIQINTDSHISGGAALNGQVEAVVEEALGRFADRITRVEVHLSDESSRAKASADDKRCLLEARLAGRQPVSVSHHGASIEQALDGAADKLQKLLHSTLGRLDDPKGRVPYGGEPSI